MNAWLLPGAAGAFWLGILVWEVHPSGLPGWAAALVGVASLVGSLLAAPRVEARDRLAASGIARPDAVAVAALGPVRRIIRPGASVAALALACIGITCLGAAWAALGQARLDASVIARLGQGRITAVGTFREDPAAGAFGWHAVVDLSSMQWSSGAASVRETLWVNGTGSLPGAVRGDLVRLEGVLARPGDPEFATALRHRGIVAELNIDTFERLGPSPNPMVRGTQAFRRFAAGSIIRLFPQPEAGLLLGLALGDASHLDPGLARDFQATGLGHLLVVSGEKDALPCCWFRTGRRWQGYLPVIPGWSRSGSAVKPLRGSPEVHTAGRGDQDRLSGGEWRVVTKSAGLFSGGASAAPADKALRRRLEQRRRGRTEVALVGLVALERCVDQLVRCHLSSPSLTKIMARRDRRWEWPPCRRMEGQVETAPRRDERNRSAVRRPAGDAASTWLNTSDFIVEVPLL